MTDEQMWKLLEKGNWEPANRIGGYDWALASGDWVIHFTCINNMRSSRMITVFNKKFDGILNNCYHTKIIDKFCDIKTQLDNKKTKEHLDKIQKFVTENL